MIVYLIVFEVYGLIYHQYVFDVLRTCYKCFYVTYEEALFIILEQCSSRGHRICEVMQQPKLLVDSLEDSMIPHRLKNKAELEA